MLLRELALAGQVGFSVAAGAVGGAFLGHLADGRLGTGALLTLLGLAAGLLGGCWVAYLRIRGTLGKGLGRGKQDN